MDNFPAVTFISTPESEANRILHASTQTANGFYCSKKFAVLPYLIKKNPSTVYLPELEYTRISNYWKSLAEIYQDVPLTYPSELVKKVMGLIEVHDDISTSVQRIQTEWNEYKDKIISFLQKNFKEQLKNIAEVEVRITAYGTKTSFNHIDTNKKAKFSCYIRQDMGASNIVEALIQGMQFADPVVNQFSWEAKEAIADFLLDRAQKHKVIPSYHPTLSGLLHNEELIAKSIKYLEKLGLTFEKKFKKENQLIYLDRKIISAQLTSIQHIILSLLIDKQNQIATYDELADILWHDEDNFSIWAINKQLQRLRLKLVSLGAEQECIQSVKGRGYSLNN